MSGSASLKIEPIVNNSSFGDKDRISKEFLEAIDLEDKSLLKDKKVDIKRENFDKSYYEEIRKLEEKIYGKDWKHFTKEAQKEFNREKIKIDKKYYRDKIVRSPKLTKVATKVATTSLLSGIGRVAGKFIPFLNWGLLAYDIGTLAYEYFEGDKNHKPLKAEDDKFKLDDRVSSLYTYNLEHIGNMLKVNTKINVEHHETKKRELDTLLTTPPAGEVKGLIEHFEDSNRLTKELIKSLRDLNITLSTAFHNLAIIGNSSIEIKKSEIELRSKIELERNRQANEQNLNLDEVVEIPLEDGRVLKRSLKELLVEKMKREFAESVSSSEAIKKEKEFENVTLTNEKLNKELKIEDVKDLNGNSLGKYDSISAEKVNNLTNARYRTDQNNFEPEKDLDFDDDFFDNFKITDFFKFYSEADILKGLSNAG